MNTMDILKEKLRETGFKITPQRRAVIDILLKHNSEHLSSEQIYDLVRVDCPEIGLATVYRTMQLLDEIGVISKLNLDDGCIRYEISLNKNECHNHHHLICKNCSKIIEVQEDLLESIESKIQERYKFDIVDHDVKFYGLCEDCKKYRILYFHTTIEENKKGSTKEINSYIIAVCSKCKSTYRFNLKHISNENEEKYEVKEGYVEVSEYVYMEK